MVAESRCPEEIVPEISRTQEQDSRFETEPSNGFSPTMFSVFGGPLLSGGSSGEYHDHVDLGEMEPLRVVSADGKEWGKAITVVPREGGYDKWEDSCLIKFSEFLGVTTAGFEEEILELMRKMNTRQKGDNRKGDPAETRCERELRKLECTINYNGKGQNRGGRDRGDLLLKLK